MFTVSAIVYSTLSVSTSLVRRCPCPNRPTPLPSKLAVPNNSPIVPELKIIEHAGERLSLTKGAEAAKPLAFYYSRARGDMATFHP